MDSEYRQIISENEALKQENQRLEKRLKLCRSTLFALRVYTDAQKVLMDKLSELSEL